ncbi:EboA domain-containing protein [Muricauda sp. 334s03]|uniref:EboA domain-containing protein n=1 Tax=Flagellimonas yonaguniensis TaxID=3031325 RepID=A0ABT5Y240_9FLAO|nr:EboA domain-containing protein [[Muricauda] yonaguniensis]MDF0717518.1 EboA domain-containing protein [[Muricauda] yonaguniensis]
MAKTSKDYLSDILKLNIKEPEFQWLTGTVAKISESKSKRDLYISYSLCTSKIHDEPITDFGTSDFEWKDYLETQQASTLELSRIFMLSSVLEAQDEFLKAVQQLIQIADKTELETFLKYLVLLPNPNNFKFAAVEALRTNIATVFNAISQYNPYPSRYFSTAEWNQMYLKSAFMQQDLKKIPEVDKMANKDLARIISDYAHERWAASRGVDPMFWRPVSNFMEDKLVDDIERLFKSDEEREQKAATLVCFCSDADSAKKLLDTYNTHLPKVEQGDITWKNL